MIYMFLAVSSMSPFLMAKWTKLLNPSGQPDLYRRSVNCSKEQHGLPIDQRVAPEAGQEGHLIRVSRLLPKFLNVTTVFRFFDFQSSPQKSADLPAFRVTSIRNWQMNRCSCAGFV